MEEQKEYPTITTCVMDSDEKLRHRLFVDMCNLDINNLRSEIESRWNKVYFDGEQRADAFFWMLLGEFRKMQEEFPYFKSLVSRYEYDFHEMKVLAGQKDMEELKKYEAEERAKQKEKHEKWRENAFAGLPYYKWRGERKV